MDIGMTRTSEWSRADDRDSEQGPKPPTMGARPRRDDESLSQRTVISASIAFWFS